MQNNITLTTLSPLHIGSGTALQPNTEYLYFENENAIALLDEHKVLEIIGTENLGQWVSCIDNNQSLLALLRQRKKDLKASDIAKIILPACGKVGSTQSLRQQLRSGNGQPILPGSSLKGAIRTALFAKMVFDDTEKKATKRANLQNNRGVFSDTALMKAYMGNDPNQDILRLLQVGDALFDSTDAVLTQSINLYMNGRNEDWRIKKEISQDVEVIPQGATTTCAIKFNETLFEKGRSSGLFSSKVRTLLPLDSLFHIINLQTQDLIDGRLAFWEKEGKPAPMDLFCEELERVLAISESCYPNECVIRLAWGTSYRNMTGGWQSILDDDLYDSLVKAVRPRTPVDLPFSKTTRFVEGGMPLGFVKMKFEV
jgi:CRISPR-associated protein Csm5